MQTDREEAVKAGKALLPRDSKENTTRLKDDSQMYKEGKAVANDAHWLSQFSLGGPGAALRSGLDHLVGLAAGAGRSLPCLQTNRCQRVYHFRLAGSG